MDKGWGLTLDSDSIGFFPNKPAGLSLTPRLNRSRGGMFSGIEFPVRLNRREEQHTALQPSDENRTVVNEVDFFCDKKKSTKEDDYMDSKASITRVKKENSHETGPGMDLDVNTGLHLRTTNTESDLSTVDDGISSHVEDKRAKNEMAVLQAEVERMNAENQRLRGMLSQVSNNYSALQLHLVTLMQQQQQQSSRAEATHQHEILEARSEDKKHEGGGGPVVPRQFMDLGPSATAETDDQPSHSSSEERTQSASPHPNNNKKDMVPLVGREESPESEGWVPNKVPKLNPSKTNVDQATEATMRKARVSVRARSEAPMITDGCQWRKYGQKMAKGNPCPRAYYRCTMAVGCPVRKQVQRCAEDRTILITTYEGTHNHPLPPAAMAMASTTSAAASMLLSGSMSSADGLMNPNFLARAILPCSSSMATISASAPFPTVTLDLTHTSPNPLQLQRPPTQFPVPFASVPTPPQPAAHVFGQALYNQSKFSGLQLSQDIDAAQLGHQAPPPQLHHQQPPPNHSSFADTLSAATAAITADPNFTAALAAAITSIMGGGQQPNSNNPTTTASTTTTTTQRQTIRRNSLLPPPLILHRNTHHVKHTLQRISNNPKPQRHRRRLLPTHHQHRQSNEHEREVPQQIQNHDRPRVRPIALPLFDLLRRRLSHPQLRLAHHSPTAGAAEEPSRAAEARRAAHEAAAQEDLIGQQRRRIDAAATVVGRRTRWSRRRHRRMVWIRDGARV